jgi:transcriptional regulator with XRE-family HTH domain
MTPDKPSGGSDVYVSQDGLEEVLRGLRRRRGITQKQVADEAGVSPAAIARIEKGDRRPSLQMLGKLAPVFATTPRDLLDAAGQVAEGADVDEVLDERPVVAMGPPLSAVGRGRRPHRLPRAAHPGRPDGRARPRPAPCGTPPGRHGAVRPAAAGAGDRGPARPARGPGGGGRAAPRRRRVARGARAGRQPTWRDSVGSSGRCYGDPNPDREPVAAMPTGEVRYVFVQALGRDERGHVWIDPLARARIGGLDHEDPRVERYDDGEIVVDVARLDDQQFGPRDPQRHRVKVTVEGDRSG